MLLRWLGRKRPSGPGGQTVDSLYDRYIGDNPKRRAMLGWERLKTKLMAPIWWLIYPKPKPEIEHEESSGNVFADLGLPDADERLVKADISILISVLIDKLGLVAVDAEDILRVDQDGLTDIIRGRLRGFSVSQLRGYLDNLEDHALGLMAIEAEAEDKARGEEPVPFEDVEAALKTDAKRWRESMVREMNNSDFVDRIARAAMGDEGRGEKPNDD